MRPRPRTARETVRELPRTLLYPVVGAAFALGAPAGLWAVRAVTRLPRSFMSSFEDLSHDPLTYGYVAASTVTAFITFGVVLGRTVDRLRAASSTDPLTGLYNRRHFHDRMSAELRRASRYGSAVSLLLIDVDRLKEINDLHGHEAGDVALRAVADALRATCRASDVVARWGGDEFVVLAPGVQAEGALELATRIRTALREAPRPVGEPSPGVSIGITDAELAGAPSAEKLYAAADAALYDAKAQGRDQAALSKRAAG